MIALQLKAVENETGLESNPLTLTWLSGKPDGIPSEGAFTPRVSNTEEIRHNTENVTGVTSTMPTGMPSFGFDSSKVIVSIRLLATDYNRPHSEGCSQVCVHLTRGGGSLYSIKTIFVNIFQSEKKLLTKFHNQPS